MIFIYPPKIIRYVLLMARDRENEREKREKGRKKEEEKGKGKKTGEKFVLRIRLSK